MRIVILLSVFWLGCSGAEFTGDIQRASVVEASPDSGAWVALPSSDALPSHASDAGEASTVEASPTSETNATDVGTRDGAPPSDVVAVPDEASTVICNTPEEFSKECALWLDRKLPEGSPCWGRCGQCEKGAWCLR